MKYQLDLEFYGNLLCLRTVLYANFAPDFHKIFAICLCFEETQFLNCLKQKSLQKCLN